MSHHHYDLPEPRPHEALQTAACISQLVGLMLLTVAVAAVVGIALGSVIVWVIG